jgi:integrase
MISIQPPENPKVVSSNLTPATISPEAAVQSYLLECSLLRRPGTVRECRRITFELIPFLKQQADPRAAAILYLSACKLRGDCARTSENRRIRIGAFFKHAGWALNIPKFKYVERPPEMFKPAELQAILAAALNARDALLWKTFWMSGLRLQEMMHLRFSGLTDQGIRVEPSPEHDFVPKDFDCRTVPIPAALLAELRALPRICDSDLVFPNRRGTVRKQMLVNFKRTARRAGIDPDTAWIHKLRSSFCTTLMRRGMSVKECMHMMGHSSLKSTMRYLSALDDADMQKKVESVWE